MQHSLEFALDNRLPDIKDRLVKLFPRRQEGPTDPLRQLVYSILCEGLQPAVGVGLFNRLRSQFPNWAALRDAPSEALDDLLIGVPGGRQKAVTLPDVLRTIEERNGGLHLDPLGRMTTEAAQRWLERLPGVSSQVASAVLAFSTLARPVVPIDRDSARPIRRLGLAPLGTPISALPRHIVARSPSAWGAEDFAELSESFRLFGRQICRHDRPGCTDCPLEELCPSSSPAQADVIAFKPRRGEAQ